MTINNPRIFTESFSAASDPKPYDFIYDEHGLRNVGSDIWNGSCLKILPMDKSKLSGTTTNQFHFLPQGDGISIEIINPKIESYEASCELVDNKITFICAISPKKALQSNVKDFIEMVTLTAGHILDIKLNDGVSENDRLQLFKETKLIKSSYPDGKEGELRYDKDNIYLFTGESWKMIKM